MAFQLKVLRCTILKALKCNGCCSCGLVLRGSIFAHYEEHPLMLLKWSSLAVKPLLRLKIFTAAFYLYTCLDF